MNLAQAMRDLESGKVSKLGGAAHPWMSPEQARTAMNPPGDENPVMSAKEVLQMLAAHQMRRNPAMAYGDAVSAAAADIVAAADAEKAKGPVQPANLQKAFQMTERKWSEFDRLVKSGMNPTEAARRVRDMAAAA